jgi:hypothetical protein
LTGGAAALAGAIVMAAAVSEAVRAAGRPALGPKEQAAVLALLDAVDVAQRDGTDADARILWDAHVLKSAAHKAYVPFAISLDGLTDSFQRGAVYVRAVARGASVEQRSELRAWIRSGQSPMHMGESVSLNAGELPVGGPGVMSSRRTTQQAAESSAVLELQRRSIEKEHAQAQRTATRDPALFPFEEYYFFDEKSFRDRDHRIFSRAIALSPGDYDFYVGVLDRAGRKTDRPILLERRVTVPDFWNDDLRLSTLILTSDMQLLAAPLQPKNQSEQPYTFGRAALAPTLTQTFNSSDVLTIVYQICNYAAPDAALTANYQFYRVDGERRLFNGTPPQVLGDDDLPPPSPWETQGFAMQVVPLTRFPSGTYELEVTVSDRVLRGTAKGVARFRVQ